MGMWRRVWCCINFMLLVDNDCERIFARYEAIGQDWRFGQSLREGLSGVNH